MALSNPDRVWKILCKAGFAKIKIDALETAIPVGPSGPGSVQKLLEVGPVARFLSDISDDVMERIQNDLSDAVSRFQTADSVMMGSATWIVSAISS